MRVSKNLLPTFSLWERILQCSQGLFAGWYIVPKLCDKIRELEDLASDKLTNLPSRFLGEHQAYMQIAKAVRDTAVGKHVSLIVFCVDGDRIKYANDTYGHSVGDQCIKVIAEAILKLIRFPQDALYRYGGDEFFGFCIVEEKDHEEEVARRIGNNLNTQIREAVLRNIHLKLKDRLDLGASIGIAIAHIPGSMPIPNKDEFIESLTKHADGAMYMAKEKPSRVVIFRVDDEECNPSMTKIPTNPQTR